MGSEKMRKLINLFFVVFLLGCTQTQLTADQIIERMNEKYNSTQDISLDINSTIYINERAITSTESTIIFKKPNKLWAYNKLKDTLTISNGEKVWKYDKKNNTYTVLNVTEVLRPPKLPDPLDMDKLKEMYDFKQARLLGSEKISGRDCYVIELKSKDRLVTLRMWIDKQNLWPPIRIKLMSGELKWIVEVANVSINTGVGDEKFEFIPPKGAKKLKLPESPKPQKPSIPLPISVPIPVFKSHTYYNIEEIERAVNFTILKPTNGYTFAYGKLYENLNLVDLTFKKDGIELLIQEYMANEIVIGTNETLLEVAPNANVEEVKINDLNGILAESNGWKSLGFGFGDIMVLIHGNISRDEIIKVSESMIKNLPKPEKVPKFKWIRTIYYDIDEIEKAVNFTILKPGAGYTFSKGSIGQISPNFKSVHLFFKKGDVVLKVDEYFHSGIPPPPLYSPLPPDAVKTNVKIRGVDGVLVEYGGLTSLGFRFNNITVLISGGISKEEIKKVAESMIVELQMMED